MPSPPREGGTTGYALQKLLRQQGLASDHIVPRGISPFRSVQLDPLAGGSRVQDGDNDMGFATQHLSGNCQVSCWVWIEIVGDAWLL